MTFVPLPADEENKENKRLAAPSGRVSHLKRVRLRGSALAWAIPGAVFSALGLILITGLSSTPWLFLLYPLLLGTLLLSLGMIALHLLHRM